MNKSESIANLAAALKKAQAEMPPAGFDATNPFLKNKYASLGSVIDTAKPILEKHGLSVSQVAVGDGKAVGVTTILMHSSGEWLEGTISLDVGDEKGKSTAQVAGSILTYLRRYSLASILNMYTDEDTDGNAPQKKQITQQQRPPAVPTTGLTVQEDPRELGLVEPDPEPTADMSLETAEDMTDSKGNRYGDMDNVKLRAYANGINVALKKQDVTDDKRAELLEKRDAIAVILRERSNV